jgi:hypothetical protein
MTQTFTLTPEQRDAFKGSGILRVKGLLPAEGVRHAREAVLRPLERLGLWQTGAWHQVVNGRSEHMRAVDAGM